MRRNVLHGIVPALLAVAACSSPTEPCQFWIEGLVTSAANGSPIEGVTVRAKARVTTPCYDYVFGCGGGYYTVAETRTDATGHYEMGIYKCGVEEVRLESYKQGYSACDSVPIARRSEGAQQIDIVLCP